LTTQSRLLTAEELAALPTEGLRLELVRGELVAMPPTQGNHGTPAMRLGGLLTHHILTHDLGEVYAAETGFLIERNPDTVRAPDFAFIAKERVTPETDAPTWVPVAPDLVVEVVSSGDRESEVVIKVQMWLDAGVRLVWVVYPQRREVVVHRPGRPPAVLAVSDTISGEDVVPGFSCPVAQVFGVRPS
jgi:Uma2 family endonuclease